MFEDPCVYILLSSTPTENRAFTLDTSVTSKIEVVVQLAYALAPPVIG